MKAATLAFHNVHYSRGDFSLSVHERFPAGLLTVILGPSGCGKTTLLDLAAGFLHPDQGEIFEDDLDVTLMPAHRRNVGVVFQEHALFNHMSVRDNVAYGPKVRGMGLREARRIALNLLQLTGLETFAGRRISSLSGGEQQRVALARALASNPPLLLLDEPFSALDAALRRRLREEIRRIQREIGITAVLVTHDQEEAMAIADRLAVMKDGKVSQFGTPAEIWNNPADLYTAMFLGRSNHLSIQEYTHSKSQQISAVTAAGTVPLKAGSSPPSLPATVFFRPEFIKFAENEKSDGHESGAGNTEKIATPRLAGQVKSSEYMGGVWKIRLSVSGGSNQDEMDFDFHESSAPETGETISLALDPAGIRVLAGSPECV